MDSVEDMGPVDYLVIEFPGNRMTGEAFPLLVDLAERGIVRIIDLAFIRKETDGSVVGLEWKELGGEIDLSVFEGASSGVLDETDLAEAAAALDPGNSAAVLVYENLWAAPLAAALRRSGAQLVASGRIPVQALLAALDATEETVPPGGSTAA
ncbi:MULTISPECIES: DUF6325 family protein [unclassified Streptomyces]|uniref:DUF6325 family protein n=1 Tax=unclassified Streptomyces TaxID=2593676 RepID=UPI000FC2C7B1|nr:DUF6325 family protein [Streptomyces sp. PanSC9]ROP46873.1 hypothetical protein EDD94_6542 [Streptomyces sp. PanSC9]